MFGQLNNIRICGMSSVVPSQIIDNEQKYSDVFGEKKVKRQINMTGVIRRHVALNETTSDMLCVKAANKLLDQLGWERDSVRAIIYVTETPRYIIPSTAFFIQKELGIGQDCIVYDMNLGCSGWVVGMQTIASLLSGMQSEDIPPRALLLAGSINTSHISPEDISTAMLFGDAGTATAIEYSDQGSSLSYMQRSDGRGYDKIIMNDYIEMTKMDGRSVFEFTLDYVVDSIKEAIGHFAIQDQDIDYYIFHQAQKFIMKNLVALLEIPDEKVLKSYPEYGNTAAASLPLTMCLHNEKLREKDKVKMLLSAFGTGLSWGTIQIDIETANIMDIDVEG